MRTYEALYIIRPDATEDAVQTISDGVSELITAGGGSIVRSEIWGKRRLAYEVKKLTEGIYVLLRFESESEAVHKMVADFRLSESVIRFLITHFDSHTLRLEEEQTRRNAEQLAARAGKTDDDDGPRAPRPRATVEA